MKRIELPELSAKAWREVIKLTTAVTVLTNVLAIAGSVWAGVSANGEISIWMDVGVPILLATALSGPIMTILSIKMQQLHHANQRLQYYATTDDLTGALNRSAFTSRVERTLEAPKECNSLLIVDIDHFKTVNDKFGHHKGDEALQLVVEAMHRPLKQCDTLGRLGGEEFGIFLPGACIAEAREVADDIRMQVAAIEFRPDDIPHALSVSIGVASDHGLHSFTHMYKQADKLLYLAKDNGRNRVETEGAPERRNTRAATPAA
jgi:diguanylate cyclase